jgi:hypothetical protein
MKITDAALQLTDLGPFDLKVLAAIGTDFDLWDQYHYPTDAGVHRVLAALGYEQTDERLAAHVYTAIKHIGTRLRVLCNERTI